MNSQTRKSSGNSCRGRTAGREGSPLIKAIRTQFYRDPAPVSSGLPIYVTCRQYGRQCAGYVISEAGRRILNKTNVRESVHYCRKHSGYGVELDALRQAHKLGVKAVKLVFSDNDSVLEAPLQSFIEHGHHDSLGGFGVQVFLKRFFWHDTSDPQGNLFEAGEVSHEQ